MIHVQADCTLTLYSTGRDSLPNQNPTSINFSIAERWLLLAATCLRCSIQTLADGWALQQESYSERRLAESWPKADRTDDDIVQADHTFLNRPRLDSLCWAVLLATQAGVLWVCTSPPMENGPWLNYFSGVA